MTRTPIPTWFFALVVVRDADRFLIVHERKHDQQWYLPAGRAEAGETLADAAVRETSEETGVPIRLIGILRLEHTPSRSSSRLRAVFLGEPTGDTPPKSVPDAESLGAAWVAVSELGSYALRGPDARELIEYVANGGEVYPLSVLQHEGFPYVASEPRPNDR